MTRYGGRGDTYCGLEDALVTPVGLASLADLVLGRVGIYYAVLAGNLLAIAGAEGALLLLVAAQLALELGLDGADLALLDGAAAVDGAVGVVGEESELVADAAVEALGLGDNALELLAGCTVDGLGERSLV